MTELNNLIFEVKRTLSLTELVPLTKILSQHDIHSFNNKGYFLGITLSEFKERFKNINPENIYFGPSLTTNGAIYIDRDKFIWIELCLFGNKVLKSLADESDEDVLLKQINAVKKYYDEKMYNNLLFICPSALRLELLKEMLNSNILENPYDLFIETYIHMEYGFDKINIDLLENVLNKRNHKEMQDFKERIKDLPEEVTVYRGEGDIRRDFDTCYSWTLDINIANFFATRYSDEKSRIIKATISKKDILDYININNENEILLNTKKLKDIEIFNLPSLKDLDKNLFDSIFSSIDLYKRKTDYLYSNNNNEYTRNHDLRLLILAHVLFSMLKIDEDLLDCIISTIIYKDISKINHEIDESHREKAIKDIDFNFKTTQFLMKYNRLDYELGIKYIEENFKEKDINNVKLLYSIIKDINEIDKVRFGIKSLDINSLRNKESINLLLIARQLLDVKI